MDIAKLVVSDVIAVQAAEACIAAEFDAIAAFLKTKRYKSLLRIKLMDNRG